MVRQMDDRGSRRDAGGPGKVRGYDVLRTFVTCVGGRVYSGVQGDLKPLPVEVAEQIERECPGRLRPVPEEDLEHRPVWLRRAMRGRQDRMVREAKEDR